jgi:vancomycin resistance protein YoaR
MAKALNRLLRRPIVVFPLCLLVLLCLGYVLLADRGVIFPGVRVEGLDVGGLSPRETQRRLQAAAPPGDEVVLLEGAGRRWNSTLSALGVRYLPELAASRAYALGRQGSWPRRVLKRALLRLRGRQMHFPWRLDVSAARRTLASISSSLPPQPRNATAVLEGEKVRIVPHQDGISLKVPDSLRAVRLWVLAGRKGSVRLVLEARPARVRSEALSEVTDLVADFHTSLAGSSRGRRHNILLAASAIDGTVLLPGESFSYNRAVGPRNPDRGYRTAPVLRRGRLVPGVGGGACQVSSTLYNAALLAGAKILKRYHHSRPVRYVSAGRDATVWYGLFDLEFENTSEAPVVLGARVGRQYLRIFALGKALPSPVKVSVRIATGGWAKPKETPDPSLAPGQRVVDIKGAPGITAIVTRLSAGKQEVVSRDYYPALPAEVRVGPAAAPQKKFLRLARQRLTEAAILG